VCHRYQCFVIDDRGELLGRHEFSATDDQDAHNIARSLRQAAQAMPALELWNGARLLGMVREAES